MRISHFQFLDAAFKKKMETLDLFSAVTETVPFLLKSDLLTSECNSGYLMGSPFGFLIIGVQPKIKSIDRNLYVGSFAYVFYILIKSFDFAILRIFPFYPNYSTILELKCSVITSILPPFVIS